MQTHYDHYKLTCVCPPRPIILNLGDRNCNELDSWPVLVLNVDGEEIGTAETKQEYINIWNSDPKNREVGTLFNFFGPFTFLLVVRPGQMIPGCLWGIPLTGIYAMEYAIEYE